MTLSKIIKLAFTKKTILLFSIYLIIGLFINSQNAHAAPSPVLDENIKSTATFLLALNDLLNTLIWPVLIMIGGLLDNSILFGSGMEIRLREIWIPIRNLVNMFFVVGLVGIAIYNITGLADDSGTAGIKGMLPKLILGIIAINFSFLGIKVFLDAVNVGTAAIFALPDQVSEGLAQISIAKDENKSKAFCLALAGRKATDKDLLDDEDGRKLIVYQEKVAFSKAMRDFSLKTQDECKAATYCSEKAKGYLDKNFCEGFKLTDNGTQFFDRFGGQNVALAMALDLSEIIYYQDVELSIDNVDKVLLGILVSLILYIIYVTTFIALFVVLLGRLVVLWVFIALSPVIILGIAVPAIGSKISALNTAKDTFIKNAIAPLIISAAMTIGWIMLKAMKSVDSIGGESLSQIYSSTDAALPIIGLTTMQDILVGIGVIAVTWVAITSAMSGTIAEAFTKTLFDTVKGVGTFIAKAPLRMPLFPINIPGGPSGKYSLDQATYALQNKYNSANAGDRGRLYKDLGGVVKPTMTNWGSMKSTEQQLSLLKNTTDNFTEVRAQLDKIKTTDDYKALEAKFAALKDPHKTALSNFMKTANDHTFKALQDAIGAMTPAIPDWESVTK